MARKAKPFEPRSSLKLWGAIRVWAWIFIFAALALIGLSAWRAHWLFALDNAPITEIELYDGTSLTETLAFVGFSCLLILAYVVGAVLVLSWYLRSVRNGQILTRGMEARPTWAVWYFIIPVVSLFKPYSMTSELWRSSLRPEGWKALRDPAMLRWWWGCVLTAGVIATVADIFSRQAVSADVLAQTAVAATLAFGLQVLAGLLFLRIGGQISWQQSALIDEGYRPPQPTIPAWSA